MKFTNILISTLTVAHPAQCVIEVDWKHMDLDPVQHLAELLFPNIECDVFSHRTGSSAGHIDEHGNEHLAPLLRKAGVVPDLDVCGYIGPRGDEFPPDYWQHILRNQKIIDFTKPSPFFMSLEDQKVSENGTMGSWLRGIHSSTTKIFLNIVPPRGASFYESYDVVLHLNLDRQDFVREFSCLRSILWTRFLWRQCNCFRLLLADDTVDSRVWWRCHFAVSVLLGLL